MDPHDLTMHHPSKHYTATGPECAQGLRVLLHTEAERRGLPCLHKRGIGVHSSARAGKGVDGGRASLAICSWMWGSSAKLVWTCCSHTSMYAAVVFGSRCSL